MFLSAIFFFITNINSIIYFFGEHTPKNYLNVVCFQFTIIYAFYGEYPQEFTIFKKCIYICKVYKNNILFYKTSDILGGLYHKKKIFNCKSKLNHDKIISLRIIYFFGGPNKPLHSNYWAMVHFS